MSLQQHDGVLDGGLQIDGPDPGSIWFLIGMYSWKSNET